MTPGVLPTTRRGCPGSALPAATGSKASGASRAGLAVVRSGLLFGGAVRARELVRDRAIHGRERRFELARHRPPQRRLGIEGRSERLQLLLVALRQLGLELDEPIDDPAAADDIDLVETELDAALAGLELALATQLAHGHELDQRRIPGMLEHQRSCVRGRPIDGRPDAVSRSFEFLASDRTAGPIGSRQRLDRDDRLAAGLAKPDGEAGPAQGPVRRVDVAVLHLGGPGATGAPGERPDRLGGQQSFGGGQLTDAVLELDLHRPRALDGHARGSSEPGPGMRPSRDRRDVRRRQGAFLEHLERVDRAVASLNDLRADPRSVRLELPRAPVVGQHQLDDLGDPCLGIGVLDRHDCLHPAIQVPVHQVGGADVPLAIAAVLEAPDPRVLQELTDDRADPDPFRDPGQPRLQRARRTHDQVDVDAGAATRDRAPR